MISSHEFYRQEARGAVDRRSRMLSRIGQKSLNAAAKRARARIIECLYAPKRTRKSPWLMRVNSKETATINIFPVIFRIHRALIQYWQIAMVIGGKQAIGA
jgi:hypothetical protein